MAKKKAEKAKISDVVDQVYRKTYLITQIKAAKQLLSDYYETEDLSFSEEAGWHEDIQNKLQDLIEAAEDYISETK